MDNNINVLDELNKGCSMGIEALDIVMKKTNEDDFLELLDNQKKEYINLSNRIKELYNDYTDDNIHEVSTMEIMMTWFGVEKDTLLDDSVSKLADLLINGTSMGIIEGRKLLNNKTMDKKINKLCGEYVKMQEKYIERLKKYL